MVRSFNALHKRSQKLHHSQSWVVGLKACSRPARQTVRPNLQKSVEALKHKLKKTYHLANVLWWLDMLLVVSSGSGEGDAKKATAAAAAAGKKKFITKEEEPQQYWQTTGKREGENPTKTPLPYIIFFGMSTPFIILVAALASGWIKMPIR